MTKKCSYCDAEIQGEVKFSIHRDGFGEGPDVPLCVKCGDSLSPTCEEIWARIAERQEAKKASYWQETTHKPVKS